MQSEENLKPTNWMAGIVCQKPHLEEEAYVQQCTIKGYRRYLMKAEKYLIVLVIFLPKTKSRILLTGNLPKWN